MQRDLQLGILAAATLAAALATAGCRCGGSTPGRPGNAASTLEAIPADVDAVIVIHADGLRQGSLGEFLYRPWVVRQLTDWGGPPCAALAESLTRTATLGVRLARRPQQVFFAAEGPTLEDIRRCVDEHARRQGLSSSYEEVEGVRGLTDSRGLHVLAAGERVVARSFPFANRTVLAEAARVAQGTAPNLAGNAAFRDLLAELGGDVTVALPDVTPLVTAYGEGLVNAAAEKIPADLCASPLEIAVYGTTARTLGFGDLPGINSLIRTRLAGRDAICLRDFAQEFLRAVTRVRAAGVTLTGRADVELGLVLVFADDATATEVRGVLADAVQIVAALPTNLDAIERDWPMLATQLQKQIDFPTLRTTLRNPAFRHLTVSGEGPKVEVRLRVDEADVRVAVEKTLKLLSRLVAQN